MRELFVWYHVRDDRADDVRDRVRALQRSLSAAWPGLQARLLIRDDGSGVQTWMETYSRAGDADSVGLDAALQAAIAAAAESLGEAIEGSRHVESFAVLTWAS